MVSVLASTLASVVLLAPPEPPEVVPATDGPMSVPVPSDRCKRPPADGRYQITLKREASLQELVEWMMSVSCQKFIWDPAVRGGKVNIVSPEPVTLSEAYAAFYAALQTMGLTVEPAGDYFKIVEMQGGAAARNLPVYGPSAVVPDDDRYATKVLRPPPGQQADVVSLLQALRTEKGTVETVGNAVLVTDTGSRLRRMLRLVDEIEVPPESRRRVYLYGIRHADPTALAEVVRSVFEGEAVAGASASAPATPRRAPKGRTSTKPSEPAAVGTSAASLPPSIAVDERTGTLIVVATAQQYAPIKRLVAELDVDDPGSHGTLHVIELRHVDAVELEAVLTALAQGKTTDAKPGPAATTPGLEVTGDVRVTAHAPTQTLVVSASASDFTAVRRVVEAIDRPQRQLYIEVYLLEVRSDGDVDFGVGGHFGKDTPDGGLGMVSSSPGGTSALNLASKDGASSLLGGLSAAFIGPQIAGTSSLIPGLENDIPAFGVVLQALETREDVNVVARPHLYAAENEEAAVEFGDSVPMNGGTTTLPGTGGGTQFSVETRPVGLSLKLLPHVNDDKTITMDVVLEDEQLGARDTTLNAFRTSKRKLDLKNVIAYPGQPVVLGGLVKEADKISESKVPGLGSVPLLGWLFKRRYRDKERVTLLMVMVPHLVDGPDDARRIHAQRLAERMEFLARYTAFKRRDLDTHVNYRKKAGLLADVNRSVRRQTREAALVDAAHRELARPRLDTEIDVDGATDPPARASP